MSALTVTVQTILAGSTGGAPVIPFVDNRIYAGNPSQGAAYPNISVHLVFNGDETLLGGAAEYPEARVSVECRSRLMSEADTIAEAVVKWLQNKHLYIIENSEVTIRKEGTDETDQSNSSGSGGIQDVSRRIVDFYVRYREL